MNIAELVTLLGELAGELRIAAPSQSKVESWIDKGLVAPSRAIGRGRGIPPAWEFPLSAVSATRLILELEAKGARRSHELRIGLWLAGHKIEIGDLREALTAESQRVVRRMLRKGFPQALQANEFGETKRTTALATKLGPLDSRFSQAGLQQPDQFYLELSKIAFLGNRGEADESELVLDALARFAPLISALIPSLSVGSVFAGLFGDPQEVDSSNSEITGNAPLEKLEEARRLYEFVRLAIEGGVLRFPLSADNERSDQAWLAMAHCMRHPTWMPLIFIIFLRLILEVKFDATKTDRDILNPDFARALSDLERMVRSLQLLAK